MILSFGDQATEDIFHGENTKGSRKIPKELWPIIQRKLDMLNAASQIRDLLAPPGNRLESLGGALKGCYSIRVNDQYRVIFEFSEGHARAVRATDYH